MGRPKAIELTDCQRETLAQICRCVDENGFPPTVQELADMFGVSAPSVHDRLNQLVHKGYLQRTEKKARGLTIARRPKDMTVKLVAIPLVGTVAGGVPILAVENIVGEVLVAETVTKGGECFALTVQGDSMIDAGINDGDTIVVRRQALAENGDIVVAMLDDEATVKRLRIDNGLIELHPENPKLTPMRIHPDSDFRVLGKVVACKHGTINR